MILATLVSAPRALAIVSVFGLLQACTPAPVPQDVLPEALPVMGWDARPEADAWTESTLQALQNEGVALLSEVPGDIGTWCPGYAQAAPTERAAFWSGLLSALARHESTWNPQAVGGGGQWFGLVQISPRTAQGYGCAADSGAALKDGAANLECAVRIAAHTVLRDGVVAAGGGGLAADWGPFASADKRAQMAAFTSQQSYCQG